MLQPVAPPASSGGATLIRPNRIRIMTKPYNPNTQGWGFALVVCLLTAGLAGTAYTIHKNTYRHPRDPMTQQVGAAADAHEGAEHGEASHGNDEHAEESHEGAKPEAAAEH